MPVDFLFGNAKTYCLHKVLFKLDCPICGITRATHLLMHGQFKAALLLNSGVLPLVAAIIQHLLSYVLKYELSRKVNLLSLWFLVIVFTTRYIWNVVDHFKHNEVLYF